jgi:hypothetical protein
MRKLILALLLLSSLFANSQIDYLTIPSSDGFTLYGAGIHLAPTNSFGHKDPWIIYLHGIDHRRAHPISANDTSRIAVIAQKGVPKLVASNPLPYYHKPGGDANAYYRWNVAFVQANSTDNQWPADKIAQLISHIRTNYGATTDTSLIMYVGYSLGGGGVFSTLRFSTIRPYIKYAVCVAAGYINTPDYLTIASEGINIDVFATVGDQLASVTLSDNWVNGIKSNVPQVVPNYFRFTDMSADNSPTDHDIILQQIVEDTTNGDTYPMTNGSTWTRSETIYQRGLRFFGPRRKANAFYWWLFFLIPINPLTLRAKREV